MAFTLKIGKCSLLGNYRENNEDTIDVKAFLDLTVAIVADGMGGQAAGEIASRKAVDTIPRELRKYLTAHQNTDGVKSIIRRAIVQANEEIMAMSALDRDMKNMGTTVVMAVWRKGAELFIASVGDSRGYRVRDKKIEPLTSDDTVTQALIEAKTLTPAEAKNHPYRNWLVKFLGSKDMGDGPEVTVAELQVGDRFLFCTDGLTGVVPDEQLASYISAATDVQQCAEGLGQLALDQNSRDNVSCIVIEVAEG